MADTTSICTRALQIIGAASISSINDDSRNARACKKCYEPRRLALLRRYWWSFAMKRVQLAADTDEPEFGFSYSYTLPADYVRLAPPDPGSARRDWVVENGKILTNDPAPLNVRYVRNVTSVGEMDPLFQEALAADMAAEMAEELTQSNAKAQVARDARKDSINEARLANAIEKGAQYTADDSWVSVRQG